MNANLKQTYSEKSERGKIIQEQKEKIGSLEKQLKDIRSTKWYKVYQYFPKKKG